MRNLQSAYKLSSQMRKLYNQITLDDFNFFKSYNDICVYQLYGVDEELDEMEVYFENPTKKYGAYNGAELFENGYCNLETTLEFFKGVIKLQAMTKKLTSTIYG